jgi:hypothetical protein
MSRESGPQIQGASFSSLSRLSANILDRTLRRSPAAGPDPEADTQTTQARSQMGRIADGQTHKGNSL